MRNSRRTHKLHKDVLSGINTWDKFHLVLYSQKIIALATVFSNRAARFIIMMMVRERRNYEIRYLSELRAKALQS